MIHRWKRFFSQISLNVDSTRTVRSEKIDRNKSDRIFNRWNFCANRSAELFVKKWIQIKTNDLVSTGRHMKVRFFLAVKTLGRKQKICQKKKKIDGMFVPLRKSRFWSVWAKYSVRLTFSFLSNETNTFKIVGHQEKDDVRHSDLFVLHRLASGKKKISMNWWNHWK